ncbi:MAG: hypothetical protein WBH12_03255 [Sediminibacterium sp.]
MLENQDMSAPIKLAEGYNPFGDEDVVPQQAQPAVEVAPTAQNEPNNEQQSAPSEQQTQQESQTSFDPNQFVREKFGFESVEQAENEFKKLKEQQSGFEFKDDVSKTLFDAIKEGKADDVYQVLNQQKRLDKLITAELNTELAIEIVKENLKQKHKELNEEEVELLFYDKFFVPLKPEQSFDETDEDYSNKVKAWEAQVDYTEKKLMIEAKMTRSELEKLKSEIRLPDIYNEAGRNAQYQEDFELMQQARSTYEQTLNSDFQSFNGFNVSVKDEDVEIPIAFNVAEEERLAMKNQLEDFDTDTYFEGRWFNKDGRPNVQQIMADKYLLENRDKIFSKIANEAASQRLLAHLKKSGNININQTATPQGTRPDLNGIEAERQRMAEWAFSS